MTGEASIIGENTAYKQPPMVKYETYIRTSPEALWNALTTGVQTAKWCYGSPIESSWKVGEPYVYKTPDGAMAMIKGYILECDPYQRLSMTYNMLYKPELSADKPSRELWEIEEMGTFCKVTVKHDDFDGETATFREVSYGLPWIISSLKSFLETGDALPFQTM